jgi:uncharacterized protein DUF3592
MDDSLPSPPRTLGSFAALRFFLHRARSSVFFLVATIFLIVGSVLTVGITGGFWSEMRRERALLAEGDSADASIVAKRAYNRSDESRVYEIGYQFPLADGRTWAATREIDQAAWNRLQAGDRLELRYDPENPDRHKFPAFAAPASLSLIGLFPLVFIVLGGLLLRSGLREIVVPLRLYRTGEATTGRVTGFETVTNERVNRRHPIRVHYVFRDGPSGEHEGSIKTLDDELLEALEKGTAVTVLYDRGRPDRNTLLAALGQKPGRRAGTKRGQA